MLVKLKNRNKLYDKLKWILSCSILLIAVALTNYYASFYWLWRLLAWIVVLPFVGLVLSTTQVGNRVINFVKDSRIEFLKISWPKRQEIVQITLVVGVTVLILSMMLWFIDGSVMWFVGWLAGQRG